MILRPRQEEFVSKTVKAVKDHGNTLSVAVTGFGKTICLSEISGRLFDSGARKGLILVHRDEINSQNRTKFHRVRPTGIKTGLFNANQKSFGSDLTFGMIQSIQTDNGMKQLPKLDFVGIDEGHHAVAPGYMRVLDRLLDLNPKLLKFNVTATPIRGDKKGLKEAGFDNVADVVSIKEMIDSGHLVKPRTMVIDLGITDDLMSVKRTRHDFDETAVAELMNKRPLNEAVIRAWKEKAGNRQSVFFCSSVEHSRELCEMLNKIGIKAEHVDGTLHRDERKDIFERLERGEVQVLCNVAVATEGWDCPPVSCVVLLRQSSAHGTYIQMIGRGLRTVDSEEYPNVIKTDCIVLDFGVSTLLHGSLETEVNLHTAKGGLAPTKVCPSCISEVPAASRECGICGHEFPLPEPGEGPEDISSIVLTEIDIMDESNWKWVDLFKDESCLMASGFESWAFIGMADGYWHAVGGLAKDARRVIHLNVGDKIQALAAADDFLRNNERGGKAKKNQRWLTQPASDKQVIQINRLLNLNLPRPTTDTNSYLMAALKAPSLDTGNLPNKYEAMQLISFGYNKNQIKKCIFERAMALRETMQAA